MSLPTLARRDFSIRLSDSDWKSKPTNSASKNSAVAQNLTNPAVAEFLDNVDDGMAAQRSDVAPGTTSWSHAPKRLVHQIMETGVIVIPSSDYRKHAARKPKLSEKGNHFLSHLAKCDWVAPNIRVRLLRAINRGHNIHLSLSKIREFIYCGMAAVHYLQTTGQPFASQRLAAMLLRRSAVIVAQLRAHWEKELAAKTHLTEHQKKLILDAHTLELSCAMRYTFLNKDTPRADVEILGHAHKFLSEKLKRTPSESDFAKLRAPFDLIMPKEMMEDACANLDQFKDESADGENLLPAANKVDE